MDRDTTKRHVWGDYYEVDEGEEMVVCTECGECSSTPNDESCPGKKEPEP